MATFQHLLPETIDRRQQKEIRQPVALPACQSLFSHLVQVSDLGSVLWLRAQHLNLFYTVRLPILAYSESGNDYSTVHGI